MDDAVDEIRNLFQRWLEGDLSEEDTLFAIGDVLQNEASPAPAIRSAGRAPSRPSNAGDL